VPGPHTWPLTHPHLPHPGFYPAILRVEEPKRYAQVDGGAFRVEADAREVKLFERALGRVFAHPASVCFGAGGYKTGWALFTELVQTSKRFAREVSMVGHYALLLAAGRLEVQHEAGEVLLDGWARLRLRARGAVLFARLRAAVDAALGAKVEDPGLDLAGHPAVEAMLELIARDGA
jgi:ATP-dependent RNA helicase DHX29